MRIFEVNDFLNRFNTFLLESFKEDMYHQYPEAKSNDDFNNAIKIFNNNQKIKEAVKKKIRVNNIAKGIKNAYPTAGEFVNFINTVISELTTKEQEREEYKQIKQGTASIGETDYWMIPCRTFKEAHDAAFKYVGNLPRLTKKEITNEYGIETPRPSSYYTTDKTPAEFLEFMKNEDNFFMAPSWCITADNFYFTEKYKLTTEPDESPRCYIFISKKYPNVRFCVTLKKERGEVVDIEDEKIQISTKENTLDEVRDSWQIGGLRNKINTGLEMMQLAFGQQKIDEVIKDIRHTIKTETIPSSKLKDGEGLFFESDNISSINTSFDSLVYGKQMFKDSNLEEINCKFPALEQADNMFNGCEKLYHFRGNLTKLSNARNMFVGCSKLENFECENLSELENGSHMFDSCELLRNFEYNLPKLKCGDGMFIKCGGLKLFDVNLPNLESSYSMFSSSGIKTFKSNLPKLKSAEYMFEKCEGLERFDIALPKLENGVDMFTMCKNLKSFNSELPNLIYGESMFDGCDLMEFEIDMPKLNDGRYMFDKNKNLIIFNCELPSLENGDTMFGGCENLTSFISNLSSLKNGSCMFYGCKKLRSFKGDLSSLSHGSCMFSRCENLKRFEGDLSSLENGYDMFKGCKLDTESVKNIAETISTIVDNSSITIGVDEMDEEKEKYIKMIEEKGWWVRVE